MFLKVHSLFAASLQLSADFILFTVFLGINLVIGLVAGRRVKSLRDFSLGPQSFSTTTITSTIVATWIGGGFMFYTLQNIYTSGLQFILVTMGGTLCLLFTGQVLSVRMGEFLHKLSVAEAMGDLYGPIVRVITAISGILGAVGYIAMQFQVIAKMITLILGFKGPGVTIAAASIVILYSGFGGIRSVIITDLLQFVVFTIFIPILGLIVWNQLKDPERVIHTLANSPIFRLENTLAGGPKLIAAIGLMLYFAIPGLTPAIFQRIAIAKDLRQVKASFTYAAGIRLLIVLSVAWIAILLLADNPNLEPNGLVNYIIVKYAYPGLKGLIAVGITAMALSTADSDLNAAAVLAVHDIIKPLKPSWQESMTLVRVFSISLGGCGLVLALRSKDLLDLLLLSGSLYMPVVTVPLLLAIFGFRSGSRAVLIGMGAGLTTVLCWNKFLFHTGINSLVPGMVGNLLFFMSSHYILKEKGGWVGIKDPYPLLAARQKRADSWKKLIQAIKKPHLYAYLQANLPKQEVVYSLFGLYVLGSTYACFFTISEGVVATYQKLYDHIAHSVIIVTAGFITYPAWPPTVKKRWVIAFAWPLGMCYILFVVGSVLMVLSGFHQVQVMLFILNIVLTALLVDWKLMVIMLLGGMMLAIGAFYWYIGSIPHLVSDRAVQFRAIYGLPLLISLLLAIIGFRRSKNGLADQTKYLLRAQKEDQARLVEIASFRQELLKELDPDEVNLFDSITSNYLKQAIYRVRDYLRLEVSELALDQLVSDIRDLIKTQGIESEPQLVFQLNTIHHVIQADIPKIKQLLVNSISYLQRVNPMNTPLLISLEDTRLGYEVSHISDPDYARKIDAIRITLTAAKELPPIQAVYMSKEEKNSIKNIPITAGFLPLIENARIIDAHYGYLDQDKTDLHIYVIPVNLREVRGKVMELLKEPVSADPSELVHPLAIQLEKDLLGKVQEKGIGLQVIHQALELIKKYHAGVKRKSGEPFFTHPMQVALIVMDYTKDQDAIVAALLHDAVEDTSLSLSHIQAMFGERVGFLVAKATNLENKLKRINLADHENLHRLINYEDAAAVLVKLADRLHNMRTITGHSSLAKQKKIAEETLTFFVPMAKNLDMAAMAQELEKLSLGVLGS